MCAPQVFGSSATSRSARRLAQRCPRRIWIVLACQGLPRCCRFPELTRRDEHHSDRSGLRVSANPFAAGRRSFVSQAASVFLPLLCLLRVDDPRAAATKTNLFLPAG